MSHLSEDATTTGVIVGSVATFYAIIIRPFGKEARRRKQEKKALKILLKGTPAVKDLLPEVSPLSARLVTIETDLKGLALGQKVSAEVQADLTGAFKELQKEFSHWSGAVTTKLDAVKGSN